jgi:transcriptional regulator with PAS, ATPase and Fis domain
VIGKSVKMQKVFAKIIVAASSKANVCIHGENGTGKELIARTIHYQSSRRDHAFVPLNCAVRPERLIEHALFSDAKWAFPFVPLKQESVLRLADHGTLFLNEIEELSLPLQTKLLWVIEGWEFRRIGDPHPLKLDTRIIATTNKDLRKAVRQRSFREDLFYRINTISIHLPPLRERQEDIPLLIDFFIQKFNRIYKKNVQGVNTSTMDLLLRYHWPGNVQQLENYIEGAIAIAERDWLDLGDFSTLRRNLHEGKQGSSEHSSSP